MAGRPPPRRLSGGIAFAILFGASACTPGGGTNEAESVRLGEEQAVGRAAEMIGTRPDITEPAGPSSPSPEPERR